MDINLASVLGLSYTLYTSLGFVDSSSKCVKLQNVIYHIIVVEKKICPKKKRLECNF